MVNTNISKIVFNKGKSFKRDFEHDYIDNGDVFHLYLYKDVLPVEKLISGGFKNNCYISIRMDLLGLDEPKYEEDYEILNRYNGINKKQFNMNNFLNICDSIIKKYSLKAA